MENSARHSVDIKSEDFVVLIALQNLQTFIMIGYTAVNKVHLNFDFSYLWALCVGTILFIYSLISFVIIRTFVFSKLDIGKYVLELLFCVSIIVTCSLSIIIDSFKIANMQLLFFSFALTGCAYYNLITLFFFSVSIGILIQYNLNIDGFDLDINSLFFTDLFSYILQIIGGNILYFRMYDLCYLIVLSKKNPCKYVVASKEVKQLEKQIFTSLLNSYMCIKPKTSSDLMCTNYFLNKENSSIIDGDMKVKPNRSITYLDKLSKKKTLLTSTYNNSGIYNNNNNSNINNIRSLSNFGGNKRTNSYVKKFKLSNTLSLKRNTYLNRNNNGFVYSIEKSNDSELKNCTNNPDIFKKYYSSQSGKQQKMRSFIERTDRRLRKSKRLVYPNRTTQICENTKNIYKSEKSKTLKRPSLDEKNDKNVLLNMEKKSSLESCEKVDAIIDIAADRSFSQWESMDSDKRRKQKHKGKKSKNESKIKSKIIREGKIKSDRKRKSECESEIEGDERNKQSDENSMNFLKSEEEPQDANDQSSYRNTHSDNSYHKSVHSQNSHNNQHIMHDNPSYLKENGERKYYRHLSDNSYSNNRSMDNFQSKGIMKPNINKHQLDKSKKGENATNKSFDVTKQICEEKELHKLNKVQAEHLTEKDVRTNIMNLFKTLFKVDKNKNRTIHAKNEILDPDKYNCNVLTCNYSIVKNIFTADVKNNQKKNHVLSVQTEYTKAIERDRENGNEQELKKVQMEKNNPNKNKNQRNDHDKNCKYIRSNEENCAHKNSTGKQNENYCESYHDYGSNDDSKKRDKHLELITHEGGADEFDDNSIRLKDKLIHKNMSLPEGREFYNTPHYNNESYEDEMTLNKSVVFSKTKSSLNISTNNCSSFYNSRSFYSSHYPYNRSSNSNNNNNGVKKSTTFSTNYSQKSTNNELKNTNKSNQNNKYGRRSAIRQHEILDKIMELDISNQKRKNKKKNKKKESTSSTRKIYFTSKNRKKYTSFLLENPKIKQLLMYLPKFFGKIFRVLKKVFFDLKKKKILMQNATWKNKIFIPERDSLGLFKNTSFEKWYVSWMDEFNKNIISKTYYIHIYLIIYIITLDFITAYKLHSTQMIISPLRHLSYFTYFFLKSLLNILIYIFYIMLTFKIKKYNCYDIRKYYFSTLFLCIAKLFISSLDIYVAITSLDYFTSPYYIYIYIHMLIIQTSILLIVRYPTQYLLFFMYVICFTSLYWGFSIHKSFMEFIFIIACTSITIVYSYILSSRTLEINRRILFSKYELPYLLYLKEIVYCLNKSHSKKHM
ncbi:conserved Plasmodium protein, unknown function [Plasmodium malariae]|uniref:Uncharacterized protein n=1 Tax=Plasmodium malariae TaxID=5858 RepID=A0A1C3KXX1_PLAMA|nr:conserved Plasmodium protein, unknown function [Plasmodium malariae]